MQAEYAAAHFRLEPGETLTFLSDGVGEACSAAWELFGFERTFRISGAGAEAIAQAAVDFGQEDNITVLTMTRLAAGEVSTLWHEGPALAKA